MLLQADVFISCLLLLMSPLWFKFLYHHLKLRLTIKTDLMAPYVVSPVHNFDFVKQMMMLQRFKMLKMQTTQNKPTHN